MDKKIVNILCEDFVFEPEKGIMFNSFINGLGGFLQIGKNPLKAFYMTFDEFQKRDTSYNTVSYHIGDEPLSPYYITEMMGYKEQDVFYLTDFNQKSFSYYLAEPVIVACFENIEKEHRNLLLKIIKNEVCMIEIFKPNLDYMMSFFYPTMTWNFLPTIWTKTHISLPLSPEQVYAKLFCSTKDWKTYNQFISHFDFVVYHYNFTIDGVINYGYYSQPSSEYTTYEALKELAIKNDPEYAVYLKEKE